MVSITIVSEYRGSPPPNMGGNRKIQGGPLYLSTHVLAILRLQDHKGITIWTQKCIRDMQNCSLNAEDVGELIQDTVQRGRFLGSEWCQQKPGGPIAACDAYSATRMEWMDSAHKEMSVEYYVKFAVAKTQKGLLVVSCHL